MSILEYQVDSYVVEIFASDLKGARTRWGEKIIRLFSQGKEVAQAVFAREGAEVPEPYVAGDKIYYFAPGHQYHEVIDLLRNEPVVHIAWKPISDPQEPNDGDAFFYTSHGEPKSGGS